MEKIEKKTITTPKCGKIDVYVQGNRSNSEVVIFTIHDLGVNHTEYLNFINHQSMHGLAERCVWVHMVVPGQCDNEGDLEGKFPTMEEFANDIGSIFDSLNIKQAVLMGEGAGANILARYAMTHDQRVLGCILIHCTGTSAGFIESVRDKMFGRKLSVGAMTNDAEKYLVLHRFGSFSQAKTELEFKETIKDFKTNLERNINPKNLNKFITAFVNRTDITSRIHELKCPALFMTGSVASHNHTVHALYNTLQKSIKHDSDRKTKTELVEVTGVANVLREKPEKVAESLQYFLQGMGLVGGYVNRKMSSNMVPACHGERRVSMQELDKPRKVSTAEA